jgi:hypothetical protein
MILRKTFVFILIICFLFMSSNVFAGKKTDKVKPATNLAIQSNSLDPIEASEPGGGALSKKEKEAIVLGQID